MNRINVDTLLQGSELSINSITLTNKIGSHGPHDFVFSQQYDLPTMRYPSHGALFQWHIDDLDGECRDRVRVGELKGGHDWMDGVR